ncbi:DNA repair protein RecO [Candidatus Saccharibacteria bacterium]|nr:DNA repair protein RecO [Candidatus Saccharibacteria bacterium]
MDDIKTCAIVLRRTNLGEADRLIDFLTPSGRISALAKAVRKEKSRLAGGVELFSISEIQVHHSVKTGRYTLTSAKMQKFYRHILENLNKLELASNALKAIERASRDTESEAYFSILSQTLAYLDSAEANLELAYAWFTLNLEHEKGNELNLMFDNTGAKLTGDQTYTWDPMEMVLHPSPNGQIAANHIKFLRLLLVLPLADCAKIKDYNKLLLDVMQIIRSMV